MPHLHADCTSNTSHYLTLPHTTSHYLTLPHITSHYLTCPTFMLTAPVLPHINRTLLPTPLYITIQPSSPPHYKYKPFPVIRQRHILISLKFLKIENSKQQMSRVLGYLSSQLRPNDKVLPPPSGESDRIRFTMFVNIGKYILTKTNLKYRLEILKQFIC